MSGREREEGDANLIHDDPSLPPGLGDVDREVSGHLSQNASIPGVVGAGGEETFSKKGPRSGEALGKGLLPPEFHGSQKRTESSRPCDARTVSALPTGAKQVSRRYH